MAVDLLERKHEILSHLEQGFHAHVGLREKRPGVAKLTVPLFHEDGDMVDIFLSRHAAVAACGFPTGGSR